MRRIGKGILIVFGLVFLAFALGPRPQFKELSALPTTSESDITNIEQHITERELATSKLKPDNEARIIWYDTPAVQTEYVLLYLPGFTATHFEASPVPENIAKKFKMNLYYARIFGHGIDDIDALKNVDPSQYLDSAKEAIAEAKVLGKKLIVMGCSTGATYATYLASEDPEIESLIFLSPNFKIYDPRTTLIDGPWGKQIMKGILGSEYREIDYTETLAAYWSKKYHIDALIALEYLLANTMTEEVYGKIEQSLFIGCYYESEENQDMIVSVEEMRNMFKTVSTPSDMKQFVEFSTVENHIIACGAVSKDVASVQKAMEEFIAKIVIYSN